MAHYALSELAIVLAGLWAGSRLYRDARFAAALGIALFSAAALMGVVRFGFGFVAEMAEAHKLAGTLGGTAAMMALVFDRLVFDKAAEARQSLFLLTATLSLGLAIALPALAVPFFLLYSLGFIYLTANASAQLARPRLVVMAMAGFMLVNVLVFRQASWMSAAASWHVFHIFVSIWIIALAVLLKGETRAA